MACSSLAVKRGGVLLAYLGGVSEFLFEAETRVELARHYKIPYARLYFVPKGTKGDRESIRQSYIAGSYRASYRMD